MWLKPLAAVQIAIRLLKSTAIKYKSKINDQKYPKSKRHFECCLEQLFAGVFFQIETFGCFFGGY